MVNNIADSIEKIPLSALNQYVYCPRRCYLIHAEGEFTDNVHTESGSREHERVDTLLHEIKQDVRIEFALPVWSDRLGLTGRCDVVEFRSDGIVYPVEYKHGKRKKWLNDDLQLTAQALCLEEMLNVSVSFGAIYHIQSRRRREVEIDSDLRKTTESLIIEIRSLLDQSRCPSPIADKKRCPDCSLNSLCQPELINEIRRIKYWSDQLFDVSEEEWDSL
ncbi:CRISPR-associated protein Cas4 [Methylotuvimicrobium alcaliphilum]|uniref:CRISPR-associated exonuclease Cas4 n=1 Tax=Methylotuvimicrobium alcaliphilum (strain DSM 19304 / NCIMB 14124 / VKM B-2133 / 20Z) TaxID=1091494 RepID=G4SWY4_META2|nr:CRISPR-associated protein Cas4 [Methylotuvimicrobium alcaliphilum]CCE23039.1 CRISPR-associated protein Cas4 [Methylotuvimicrobium alcaliphilum 20Z]